MEYLNVMGSSHIAMVRNPPNAGGSGQLKAILSRRA